MARKTGFEPVFDKDSKVLILGSFPSVKSREIQFYYGNKQNRFWRTVCGYFGESIPETVEDKKAFLYRRKIALWDIVVSCEIQGSADATVKNAKIADLSKIIQKANLRKILLNGTLAYNLFLENYRDLDVPYEKLPSTSPGNPRFDHRVWEKAFDEIFKD